ncbi:hypothetical protein [Candidatus Williamhamiltonella defendens]|uniref:hypothetical protein n=1 Tax=Candidatus Williamhamiltonella defendens TaxID=138072 RepID=UPI00130E1E61|nr:hypothetical protein [Candidatus Hamiltonella defensa]
MPKRHHLHILSSYEITNLNPFITKVGSDKTKLPPCCQDNEGIFTRQNRLNDFFLSWEKLRISKRIVQNLWQIWLYQGL